MHNIAENKTQKSNFIVLVTPSEEIADDWNGAIHTIKSDAKRNHDDLLEKFNTKIDIVRDSIKDLKKHTN